VLVYATGFRTTDFLSTLSIHGPGGDLSERWADGASAYLGMAVPGFPNMFMILGPNGPFTNLPPSIEAQVEWISDLIATAERDGLRTIEPTQEAEDGWTATCREIADATLFPKAESWIFGANIPGKKNAVMFYMAGHSAYRQKLAEIAAAGYEGFALDPQNEPAGV